jgi:hypothetical protein
MAKTEIQDALLTAAQVVFVARAKRDEAQREYEFAVQAHAELIDAIWAEKRSATFATEPNVDGSTIAGTSAAWDAAAARAAADSSVQEEVATPDLPAAPAPAATAVVPPQTPSAAVAPRTTVDAKLIPDPKMSKARPAVLQFMAAHRHIRIPQDTVESLFERAGYDRMTVRQALYDQSSVKHRWLDRNSDGLVITTAGVMAAVTGQ